MYTNYSFRASKCMHEVKKARTFESENNRPYDYDALLLETNLHEAKQARTFESENKSLRLWRTWIRLVLPFSRLFLLQSLPTFLRVFALGLHPVGGKQGKENVSPLFSY